MPILLSWAFGNCLFAATHPKGDTVKKKIKIIVIVILLLIALIPIPQHLKDGGTVRYQALLYCVSNVHSLAINGGYDEGITIEILGIEVFNNVRYAG